MSVAVAAAAAFDVILEVRVRAREASHAIDRRVRQWRTAEIGVDDDARGIDHSPQRRPTGVVVPSHLRGSPLPDAAIDRVRSLAGSYSNLEYDIDAGGRGNRDTHAEALLTRLLGVEAAVVVNNNAAATLLMLAALASGREVIVSRGELVE